MALTRQQKIDDLSQWAYRLVSDRRNGARGNPDQFHSAEWLYKQSQGTDLKLSRSKIQAIYKEQLYAYRAEKFSPIMPVYKEKILPKYESKTRLVKEYSFLVRRGYLVDDSGNYILDKNGARVENLVTVISDKKLTRKQILESVEKPNPLQKDKYGQTIKPAMKIIRMLRNRFR